MKIHNQSIDEALEHSSLIAQTINKEQDIDRLKKAIKRCEDYKSEENKVYITIYKKTLADILGWRNYIVAEKHGWLPKDQIFPPK